MTCCSAALQRAVGRRRAQRAACSVLWSGGSSSSAVWFFVDLLQPYAAMLQMRVAAAAAMGRDGLGKRSAQTGRAGV
jgi:hypothetical protein